MRTANQYKIIGVDLVYNPTLEAKFDAKRREFAAKGIPSKEVLAFHGTPSGNIDSIIRTNLQYTVSISLALTPGPDSMKKIWRSVVTLS